MTRFLTLRSAPLARLEEPAPGLIGGRTTVVPSLSSAKGRDGHFCN
jgi:hypothetical protein